MPERTSFQFVSRAYSSEAFQVVSFTGEETLSQPYEFNINIASEAPGIDPIRILNHPASFIIRQDGRDYPYHGIVINIDQVNRAHNYTFYQAVLVPRLHWLTLFYNNQVFLNKTIPEILKALLGDAGLTTMDYEFRLMGGQSIYRTREMVCQYGQTHFDFFSFWAECMGLYYFFEQNADREKLIVTDTHAAHEPFRVHAGDPPAEDEGRMMYVAPSGMRPPNRHKFIYSFRRRQRLVPRTVRMRDYDFQKPTLDLRVEAKVFPSGPKGGNRAGPADPAPLPEAPPPGGPPGSVGQISIHGDPAHYTSPDEGRRLARIRAEEIRCRETVHAGLSQSAVMRPGFTFDLADHYQDDFNRKYVITRAEHSGNQAAYLTGGLSRIVGDEGGRPLNLLTMTMKRVFMSHQKKPTYENRFVAVPAEVQFRPERKTEPSRIWGTIHAVVDGSGSGRYAEIDDLGRYKVVLPFDSSDRKGLKASAWIRMAQPTGGGRQGMHFPLRPGTEILLSFMAGDPNRPVIVGSIPNTDTPNVITSANSTRATLQSESGNQILMEDADGQEFLALTSSDGTSQLALFSTSGSKEEAPSGEAPDAPDDNDQNAPKDSGGASTYTLTLIISGGGTVAQAPEGTPWGENCSEHPPGTVVTLTATGEEGAWNFTGWSNDADGAEASVSVTMDGNRKVTATFERPEGYDDTINYLEYVLGNQIKYSSGASNSIFLGTKADLFVGTKFGCTVAAVNDLFLGLKSSISTALSNTINLGGSVNLTCADSISMGTGTQVSMFKKKNHVAQEEMTLSGGMAEVDATAVSADDEVQLITTEVVSVLCGSLMTLAAAGITTNTDADIVEKYPGMSSCMTTVSSAVTVFAAIAQVVSNWILFDSVKKKKSISKAAELKLNRDGMTAIVQPPATSLNQNPEIYLSCHAQGNDPHSSLALYNDSSSLISKKNASQQSEISADAGDAGVELKRKGANGIRKISITDDGIDIIFGNGKSENKFMSINKDCMELKHGTAYPKLGKTVELKNGNHSLLKNKGENVEIEISNGSVKTDPNGNLLLDEAKKKE